MFVYYIQLITFYYYRIIILLYIIIIIFYLKQNTRPSIGGNLCMTHNFPWLVQQIYSMSSSCCLFLGLFRALLSVLLVEGL